MGITPVKTPKIVKKALPKYVWEKQTNEKILYLTFDDGPTPNITDQVLNLLSEFHAKATFFCIGNNVEKHPEIFKNILSKGHAIGNHTQNHLKGWKTDLEHYLADVDKAQDVINSELKDNKFSQKLFRPPYGKIKPSQGKALINLGYTIVMWNVLSFDWDNQTSPDTCLKNVLDKSEPGSIIVFHDSEKAAKNLLYALPKVLEHFSNKGYTFKALAS
ncbi:polysaccharide deacetylase family protein [Hanstruepera neustonica]|uniref:Polysaccharide deacetylase family protein n=1 Tax=Hanstruepera neustonica TaxID=1445657 RepID=A0A2K1E189_9FLAO|nr:polysaccharide deacetylase family protein [Hanstruepera neustonica]PNQ74038.1 polysaccharide deacetylase family protein [Hanstruepera neustonica]